MKAMARPLAAVLCAFTAGPAHAQDFLADEGPCELDISGEGSVEWEGVYGRGYDVFGSQVSYEPVELRIRHRGAPCDFFLTAQPLSSGGENAITNGVDRLVYDLRSGTNGPSLLSDQFGGSPSSRLEGRLGGSQNATSLLVSLSVPPSQLVSTGTYTGQVMIQLFREDRGSPRLVAEWPLSIVVPVWARLRITSDTFGDTHLANIDLGELSSGAQREAIFDVASNAPVDMVLRSANAGALQHDLSPATIPYRVRINGSEVDLAASAASFAIRNASQARLEVSVEPDETYLAGNYSDVLTVTFTAQ